MTSEQAAALPLAGLTALRLARATRLAAGTSVLMTGASGGVGHYFAELAANCAARLTAVVRSPARGEFLRTLGADTIADLDHADDRLDVGMDSVGGPTLSQVRRHVDPTDSSSGSARRAGHR